MIPPIYPHFKTTIIILFFPALLFAQQDTLKVMTYNVLNYGDGCQGSNAVLHNYLKTIVGFTRPDILGMVKMNAISYYTVNGVKGSFADSIVKFALNPAMYGYCTFTNLSDDSKVSVLFYNKNKLGFISTTTLAVDISDFNLYKLFYKDPNLAATKDTTFLYVVLNHTQSGTDATTRNQQEAEVIQAINNRFYKLPNILIMGDFNIHNSGEQFYQNYVAATDTNFRLYDTPFALDNKLSYPIDWDNNPAACAAYLTTSTRQSATIPNSCGTDGGAKSWYDHILVSSWIKNKTNYISYVPGSYQTIGNDGYRLGISINDSSAIKNTSAPSNVINALFQLSNKYPVSLKLAITSNSTGQSLSDPDKPMTVTGIAGIEVSSSLVKVVNPVVSSSLQIYFTAEYAGQVVRIAMSDQMGRMVYEKEVIANNQVGVEFSNAPGIYHLSVFGSKSLVFQQKIIKY